MNGLTWLHISDWHQPDNKTDPGKLHDRRVVFEALCKDIKKRSEIHPDLSEIDFVVFSGDVASKAQQWEYRQAKKEFFDSVLEASGVGAERVFIVPGNHDLNKDALEKLEKSLLEPIDIRNPQESDRRIKTWLSDKKTKKELLKPFKTFSNFVSSFSGQKSAEYASICRWTIRDKEIALLGLNSAWMGRRHIDGSGKPFDRGFLAIGEPQIEAPLDDIVSADVKIAVFHHPLDWLAEFDFVQVERTLRSKCDFILCGHTHKPRVEAPRSTHGNAIIIPAGASYRKRIEDHPSSTSSYNLVHLDFDTGKGVVFLRRWDEVQKLWTEDSSTHPSGEFPFHLPFWPASIPGEIPGAVKDFKGRTEKINEVLAYFDRGITNIGIHGLPGIGKTQLAYKLAEKLQSKYIDGQLMVRMLGTGDKPLGPSAAMAQIIHSYHPSVNLPDDEEELRRRYLTLLSNKKVLILLDNARDEDQILLLLPPQSCGLISTSRKMLIIDDLKPVNPELLDPDEARDLLLAICPRIGNQADELARICGFLPLALRASASLLAAFIDMRPDQYVKELRDENTRLESLSREGVELTVEASINLSYQYLPQDAATVFEMLSVFPFDFEAGAEEIICQDRGHEHLSYLLRWGLVEYDQEAARYHLHDLVRIFAASRLERTVQIEAQQRHAEYYRDLLINSNELCKEGGDNVLDALSRFDLESANIKTGQAWAAANFAASARNAKTCSDYARAWDILNLRLNPRDYAQWLTAALAAARYIQDAEAECFHLLDLGIACCDLGQTIEVVEYYWEALAVAQEKGYRKLEGKIQNMLGSAIASLGHIKVALEFYQKALAIDREIHNRLSEGRVLGNLGLAYSDLGDPRKAIEYYDQALKISREIGNRRGEGADLGNLGSAYSDLGELRKAIEYYDQALKISREIGDRRGEGADLGNLGTAYFHLGEPRKTIEYYEQALKIAQEIGDRRGEGNHLGNLGNVCSHLGDPLKAIEYYEQALKISRDIGDRRGEGNHLFNMSLSLNEIGQRSKAVEAAKDALRIFLQIESPNAKAAGMLLLKLFLY